MKEYGYARVSTKEQHPDRQIIALKEYGVPPQNIFLDKISGKNFDRPAWQELIDKLETGDILVVKSIDRLGRNYLDILDQWRFLARELQVDLIVLDMPILDTRVQDDLTRKLISDIVLQLLSYVAESERHMIHKRQEEGIAAAKERGVRFGRPPKDIPAEFGRLYNQVVNGELSRAGAARILGISPGTFSRMGKRYEARSNVSK